MKRAVEVGAQAARSEPAERRGESPAGRWRDNRPQRCDAGGLQADRACVTNDATVLLSGESGTGKELVARAIHFKSRALALAVRRRQLLRHPARPARESNCSGTNAAPSPVRTERRAGKFEMADKRHNLPRRNRRPADRIAAQAAARAAGAGVQPGRQRRDAQGQGARNRRNQPEPREPGCRAQIPRGPVLSAAGDSDSDAGAARAARRYCGADRLFRLQGGPADGRASHHHQPRSADQTGVRRLAG